jgi:hypothetical protein
MSMNNDASGHPAEGVRLEGVGPERHGEPDDWERLLAAFRTAAPRGSAPPWLEQRVMAEIEALPERSPLQRVLGWLVRPAPVRVSPLAAGLAAAAVVALILLPPAPAPAPRAGSDGDGPTAGIIQSVVYVQFALEAPTATSVAVAGDFSDWQPAFTLTDADGDGVWTGRVPVQPGVHGYMFLVDETRWQTDPRAERYQDDGFGNRNAVLAVGASS